MSISVDHPLWREIRDLAVRFSAEHKKYPRRIEIEPERLSALEHEYYKKLEGRPPHLMGPDICCSIPALPFGFSLHGHHMRLVYGNSFRAVVWDDQELLHVLAACYL